VAGFHWGSRHILFNGGEAKLLSFSSLMGSAAMAERILLVDYENIKSVDLEALPDDVKVGFVLGGKQGTLPTNLVVQAQSMGSRFDYVRILSVERNACDLCIAYYLGELLHANPQAECVLLSKDKGFDPLVKHLTVERGFKVRRVSEQQDAFEESSRTTLKTPFERLIWLLKKEKVLPRKRKGLEGKVKHWFPDLSAADRDGLLSQLFQDGVVKESEKKELTFFRARLGDK
jgi:PIN domain-containing protein